MQPSTIITIIGLSLSAVGAFVIAIPDIPQLRKCHRPGRMLEGLNQLELALLHHDSTGFEEIKEELEEMSDQPIGTGIIGLHVAAPEVSIGSGPDTGMIQYLRVQRTEDESEEWADIPFEHIRAILERKIRKGEGRIHGVGFLIFGLGFLSQLTGVLW